MGFRLFNLDKNAKLGKFVREQLPTLVKGISHAEVKGVGKSGAEKLELAADFVAGLFDIPMVPEFVEALLIKAALTALVELAKLASKDQEWLAWLLKAAGLEDELPPEA